MGIARVGAPVDPITREIDEYAEEIRSKVGFITKLQSRQLGWLRRWGRTERRERLRLYTLKCEECDCVERQHVAAVMARILVERHAGHETWLDMFAGAPVPRGL